MTVFPLPHPATAHRAPLPERARRFVAAAWRRMHAWLVLAILLTTLFAPRAWDADAMQRAAQAQGGQAVAGVKALQALLASLGNADESTKLTAINTFFDRRIAYGTDQEVWGQLDYWASPVEMLGKGRGDCEDYVIGKYFSLLVAGVPVAKMRLVYVRATMGGPGGEVVAHMVLAYYPAPGADPLVLDNLITDIRPASHRPDLEPVFSFNSDGLWKGVGAQAAGDPANRLSPWREVLAKARAEGFL